MKLEEKLKEYILSRYKSILEFSNEIDMPYATIASIFKRGISNSSVTNIIKICNALEISADELANGNIVKVDKKKKSSEELTNLNEIMRITKINISSVGLMLDGVELRRDEKECIFDAMELVVEFIRRNRKREKENAE